MEGLRVFNKTNAEETYGMVDTEVGHETRHVDGIATEAVSIQHINNQELVTGWETNDIPPTRSDAHDDRTHLLFIQWKLLCHCSELHLKLNNQAGDRHHQLL